MFNFSNLRQLLVLSTVLCGVSASAQWADDQPMPRGHEDPSIFTSTSGVFVGVSKAFWESEVSGSDISTGVADVEQKLGVYVGYQSLRQQNFGFSARGIVDFFGDDSDTIFRAEGNGTFGISEQFHFFGGLNISKFLGKDEGDLSVRYTSKIGYQVGAGIKLNETIGMQAQYSSIDAGYKLTGLGIDEKAAFNISGIELGFNIFF